MKAPTVQSGVLPSGDCGCWLFRASASPLTGRRVAKDGSEPRPGPRSKRLGCESGRNDTGAVPDRSPAQLLVAQGNLRV